ncbi:MAG: excinuclease ABC subunit UvrA [Aureliella sp.]
MSDFIRARGIRVHNLKNVDVDLPRGELIAVCGVSGSGKTSLALDTLYAEGQRRYIESFSAYTRQFLDRLERPDFDSIEGLPPALAVTRGHAARGNRSTVGTASETLDYLRLLFANVANLSCYSCGRKIQAHSPQSVASLIERMPKVRLMVAFRCEWQDVGERASVLYDLQQLGFVRLATESTILHLSDSDKESQSSALPRAGSVSVVVDRLQGGDAASRTTESLETAFEQGYDSIELYIEQKAEPSDALIGLGVETGAVRSLDGREWRTACLSRKRICNSCDIEYPDPESRLFSFNSPLGACEQCEGFGDTIDLDRDLIVPDRSLSINEGAIAPWNSPAYEHNLEELRDVAPDLGIPLDLPFSKLNAQQVELLYEGEDTLGYEGIDGFFRWLERKKYKMHVRVFISRWRSYNRCSSCHGNRLNELALSYRVGEKNFAELCAFKISELARFLGKLHFTERDRELSEGPLEQALSRVRYLMSVGLGYLQLNRPLRTLSGGEAQRTALTAALGSNLVNMLYVLDEPSVGLHSHDVGMLVKAIRQLTDRDNTVLVVEHEEELLREADRIIEIGPAAGRLGGTVVYDGPVQGVSANSQTLAYLNRERQVATPAKRRESKRTLRITGCNGNNLKKLDVQFPLGVMCVVSGVSGSGKSTLVQDTLYPAVCARLEIARNKAAPYKSLTGLGAIKDCISVDQSPVSKSPRSNAVTYVKAFDEIRKVFAETSDARVRGMTPGHFSFNSDAGRCGNCKGDGQLEVDMHFLADVRMVCPDCRGSRYRPEILSVRYRDRTIADVLQMTVREALDFFRREAKITTKLQVLDDVGLGYLQLGQSATTLSSGEAQRLKLAGFLAAASKKRTLFVMDEPTTGLHFSDVSKLLQCFSVLLQDGHSLVIVEHNIPLIAAADYVIDLGPGAGDEGGQVIASGTPEQVAKSGESVTAKYLAPYLAGTSN